MNKIFVVASTEFGTAVRSKGFFVGILLMPVMVFGSIVAQKFAAERTDVKPKTFAVIDHQGTIFPRIEVLAKNRNAAMVAKDGKRIGADFVPEKAEDGSPEGLLALSDRVRAGNLFAFVEIPRGIIEPNAPSDSSLRYFSDNPNDDNLRNWLQMVVSSEVRDRRFKTLGIDEAKAQKLQIPTTAENLGLLNRKSVASTATTDGKTGTPSSVVEAEQVDKVRTFALPAIALLIVFLVVMSSAPQLLNTVIEEKMSKISEVLLGSASSFELMMGKLLGNVALALLLAVIYVGGAYSVACYYGYGDAVPPSMFPIMAFFIVLAILLFGSMYSAVGAACSELKDAQTLMMPVFLLTMLPAFFWIQVIQSPSSSFSVGLSMFPPCTPFLMLTRMLLRPAPPMWQVATSAVLTTLTAIACVWAAGKIFRVGLLMHGKPPTFGELARWIFTR